MSTVEALKKIEKAENSGNLQDLVDAVDACKSALAEVEASSTQDISNNVLEKSEPVAYISINRVSNNKTLGYGKVTSFYDETLYSHVPLFTFPPRREWKGLSRDEKTRISLACSGHLFYELCNAIEAKLKELNHD